MTPATSHAPFAPVLPPAPGPASTWAKRTRPSQPLHTDPTMTATSTPTPWRIEAPPCPICGRSDAVIAPRPSGEAALGLPPRPLESQPPSGWYTLTVPAILLLAIILVSPRLPGSAVWVAVPAFVVPWPLFLALRDARARRIDAARAAWELRLGRWQRLRACARDEVAFLEDDGRPVPLARAGDLLD